MEKNILINVDSVTKRYDRHVVLDNINLNISRGQGVAFIGENGCGKSTLLRILAGLTSPNNGLCEWQKDLKLAFMPDHYERLTFSFQKYMEEMLKLEGIYDASHRKEMQEYYEGFALHDMLHIKMKDLSKGTLQKAAVIQAMIGERDIIFMDEPLSGQDYSSQVYFVEQMKVKKAGGTTLVMACHEGYLIEELADEIYRIKEGRLVDGQVYLLRRKKGTYMILLQKESGCEMDKDDILKLLIPEEAKDKVILEQAVQVLGNVVKITAEKTAAEYIVKRALEQGLRLLQYKEIMDT